MQGNMSWPSSPIAPTSLLTVTITLGIKFCTQYKQIRTPMGYKSRFKL